MKIDRVKALEYLEPLREGGSLPAIIRADDQKCYVMKFTGAGQGKKALIAELIGSELARLAGFKVPQLVFAELDEEFGKNEPDPEIQDLLRASHGVNLGMAYLEHSATFNLLQPLLPSASFASKLVWLDAYLVNVDRTPRNVNMLIHDDDIWLIDFGAALYFHHNWETFHQKRFTPFPLISDHVLLPLAAELDTADRALKMVITEGDIDIIVELIPDNWLRNAHNPGEPGMIRDAYRTFLKDRLKESAIFLKEAVHARSAFL